MLKKQQHIDTSLPICTSKIFHNCLDDTRKLILPDGLPETTDGAFSNAAEALIKKHPFLLKQGCYRWKLQLKTKLKKAQQDALPGKKVERPRRGEAKEGQEEGLGRALK